MKSDAELLRTVVGELPPRQLRVLTLLLDGGSEKTIAFSMGLSAHTVHAHTKALHKRFGVSSRTELIAMIYKMIFAELRRIAQEGDGA